MTEILAAMGIFAFGLLCGGLLGVYVGRKIGADVVVTAVTVALKACDVSPAVRLKIWKRAQKECV